MKTKYQVEFLKRQMDHLKFIRRVQKAIAKSGNCKVLRIRLDNNKKYLNTATLFVDILIASKSLRILDGTVSWSERSLKRIIQNIENWSGVWGL